VFTDILRQFPATVELAVAAIVLALLFEFPSASSPSGEVADRQSARLLALTGVSMPIFWLGVMLAWVFAVELRYEPPGPARQRGTTGLDALRLLDAVLQRNGR
jgi:peptide/nickel transport system permease protein